MGKENKKRMPETVKNIIASLAKPYGIDILALLKDKVLATQKYLSIKDAERYSSLSRWTLWRAIKTGKLKATKLSYAKHGRVLIKKGDLEQFIENEAVEEQS